MKKILIITSHFPPSNLVGVHRSRILARHLPDYGWEPVILTVHEDFYEEKLDTNLAALLPENLRIEKVSARKITRPRLIGDIGLRAFFSLRDRAVELIKKETFDFLLVTLPSFYLGLIARSIHNRTGIKYGIDYRDPWVHDFAGSKRSFSRAWWATKVSRILEPIAVKKAAVITGVAKNYYQPVFTRNLKLKNIIQGSFPVGFEKGDFEKASNLESEEFLFKKKKDKIQLIYAGAIMPQARIVLEKIFISVRDNPNVFTHLEFHFIGTGKTINGEYGHGVIALAEKMGLWMSAIFEYPERMPYVDLLRHYLHADAILILGSTEAHYSPSKIYQAVFSRKPILAILHENSPAVAILEAHTSAVVVAFSGMSQINELPDIFRRKAEIFNELTESNFAATDLSFFDQYAAKAVTGQFVALLNQAITNND